MRLRTNDLVAVPFSNKGANITKLALLWTLRQEGLPTTLVSTSSMENLRMNLDALSETLSERDEQVNKFDKKNRRTNRCNLDALSGTLSEEEEQANI